MRALASIAVIAALLLVSCAQGPAKVTVTMEEWSIKLSQTDVPAGPVTFGVKNTGTQEHELVLLKTDIAPDKLPDRATDPTKADEPGNVGEIEDISSGSFKEATFDLTPGKYVLICNVASHYKSGMRVSFVVK